MENKLNVLGISGSLRAASLNSTFLRAMGLLCPPSVAFDIYRDLDRLPLFNPDAAEQPDAAVAHWRAALNRADLILLVSPEYANGVTGVIKNALDWIVGSGELTDKPIAFPNLSVRAGSAQAQLADTLRLMGGRLLEECSPRATLAAPLVMPEASEYALVENAEIAARLASLWRAISSGSAS